MKSILICIFVLLSLNGTCFSATVAQLAGIDVESQVEGSVYSFKISNRGRSSLSAYAVCFNSHNLASSDSDWRVQWFDSAVSLRVAQSLGSNESRVVKLGHIAGDRPIDSRILAVIFEDGQTAGDPEIINAMLSVRKSVSDSIRQATDSLRTLIANNSDTATALQEFAKAVRTDASEVRRRAPAGSGSMTTQAIALYQQSASTMIADQIALLLGTRSNRQTPEDFGASVVGLLNKWQHQLELALHN